MKRIWVLRLSALGFTLAICLGIAEIGTRMLLRTTPDGMQTFMRARLKPYRLPVRQMERNVRRYLSGERPAWRYDPLQGWILNPAWATDGNPVNSIGMRSDRQFDRAPPDGVLRIAAFGDSFVYGGEVDYEDTWPLGLEEMLAERGIPTEVLNFGVPAYGIDQAYLRWRHVGREYDPDVVIFGFMANDVYRNMNLIQAFYISGTGIPFSKPRFVLEAGRLRLVNSPTVPVEELPGVVASFPDHPLARHEFYFAPEDHVKRWWMGSRFAAFVAEGLSRLRFSRGGGFPISIDKTAYIVPDGFWDADGDATRITLEIVKRWQAEAEADGARFLVVHFPRRQDLEDIRQGRSLEYQPLLDAVRESTPFVETSDHFDPDALDPYFALQEHYSPKGSNLIASVLAETLLKNNKHRN